MFPVDDTSQILVRLMDAAALRHHVVSQNLANVNTPGYRRLEVSFEEQLAKSWSAAPDARGLADAPPPTVRPSDELSTRADGNTVNLEREIGDLNRAALLYETYTQVLNGRLSLVRRAIGPS
jgi:flagellar basal-body rod protein FlgB